MTQYTEAVNWISSKGCSKNFRKTHLNPFLQNTSGRLLLWILVEI